jgi:hypothetical protein
VSLLAHLGSLPSVSIRGACWPSFVSRRASSVRLMTWRRLVVVVGMSSGGSGCIGSSLRFSVRGCTLSTAIHLSVVVRYVASDMGLLLV